MDPMVKTSQGMMKEPAKKKTDKTTLVMAIIVAVMILIGIGTILAVQFTETS